MKLSKFIIFLFFIFILFNLTYCVYEGESSNAQQNPQPNFQQPNLGAHPGYAPIPQTNVHGYHILTPTQHGQKHGTYGNLISFDQNVPGYAPSSGLPVGETSNNITAINQNQTGHVNQDQTYNHIPKVQNYHILKPTLPEGGLPVGGSSSIIVNNQSGNFNLQQHVQLTRQQTANVPNYHILTPTQQDGQQTGRYGKLISLDPNVPGYTPMNRRGGQH
uniref:Uncharacterized protein n=1 Tax=Meloidogyne floridensis TaxID=298350 RepID=A0A915NCW2_9BILA